MRAIWFGEWDGFKQGTWTKEVNVASFINKNFSQYEKDETFLTKPTKRTNDLLLKIINLIKNKKNALFPQPSHINAFEPGYIDKNNEIIFGLQTEQPFVPAFYDHNNINEIIDFLDYKRINYNSELLSFHKRYYDSSKITIENLLTSDIKNILKANLISDFSLNYSRNEIFGDYRRVALYGVDLLIKQKNVQFDAINSPLSKSKISIKRHINLQIEALKDLKKLAQKYGINISRPASNAKEAIQWIYFAFLASTKQSDSLINVLGRISTFLDIYIERDINKGTLTEEAAQEIIDQLFLKLKLINFFRNNKFENEFVSQQLWINEAIGGLNVNDKHLITKTSYRFINSLVNLQFKNEPNLIILWSKKLPYNFKKYCVEINTKYHCLQFRNDDKISKIFGHDYACSFSSNISIGKQNVLSSGCLNLSKALLYAINSGWDEINNLKHNIGLTDIDPSKELNFYVIWNKFKQVIEWLVKNYIDYINVFHYWNNLYNYEGLQYSLCDANITYLIIPRLVGLIEVVDSLCAIKEAKVTPIFEGKIAKDFTIEGNFSKWGTEKKLPNQILKIIIKFINKIFKKYNNYSNSKICLSDSCLSTGTSIGKTTGSLPNGRLKNSYLNLYLFPNIQYNLKTHLENLSTLSSKYMPGGITNSLFISPTMLKINLDNTETYDFDNLINFYDYCFSYNISQFEINIMEKSNLDNIDAIKTFFVQFNNSKIDLSKAPQEIKNEIKNINFCNKID